MNRIEDLENRISEKEQELDELRLELKEATAKKEDGAEEKLRGELAGKAYKWNGPDSTFYILIDDLQSVQAYGFGYAARFNFVRIEREYDMDTVSYRRGFWLRVMDGGRLETMGDQELERIGLDEFMTEYNRAMVGVKSVLENAKAAGAGFI